MTKMQYLKIDGVGKPISRILMGTASGPLLAGQDGDGLLTAAFEAGLSTIDTARQYGQAEQVVGRWLQRTGLRDKVTLLTKGAHHDVDTGKKRVTPADIRADLAASLEALQTGFVDIYLLHRDDPEVPVGPIVEVLNELHAQGKIGAFGGSNWTHQRLQAANDYAAAHGLVPFTFSSPYFGLADEATDPWGGGVSIAGPGNRAAQQWYTQHQMPVIAYSSLGRGLFSGKVKGGDPDSAAKGMDEFALKGYASPDNFERLRRAEKLAAEKGASVPQVALAWLFAQPMPTFSILGTTNPARFAENIGALNVRLTPQEMEWLDLRNDI
ncbi:aldo/keto reductase [Ruminococcaceae bacterium OttesenSCG-928-A11]|nr:aldo/keto reductase [Ruminococcaceae bacterium OttesenSCG-928-A11]